MIHMMVYSMHNYLSILEPQQIQMTVINPPLLHTACAVHAANATKPSLHVGNSGNISAKGQESSQAGPGGDSIRSSTGLLGSG